jgi:hypothetical protein
LLVGLDSAFNILCSSKIILVDSITKDGTMSTRFFNKSCDLRSTTLESISIKKIGLFVKSAYPNVVVDECVNKKQSTELATLSNDSEIISSTILSYNPLASESLSG